MSKKNKTEAEKLFLEYKKQFIKQLGKDGLYNDQFKDIVPFLNGVYCDDTAIIKQGYYIINTDISSGKGIHWIGCYQTKKTIYLYDSFSRTPTYLLPLFINKIKKKGLKIITTDKNDDEQYGNISQICGQLCAAWLMVVKKLGIRKALTI